MLPPGPRAPARIQMLNWILRPTEWLDRCRARYGPAFTLRMRGYEPRRTTALVVLCQREHARTVLLGDPGQFAAGAAREAMAELQGPDSIFLRDEAAHVAERKLLLPQFHGEQLDRWRLEMMDAARRSVARWPRDREFALLPLLQELTLKLIVRVMFGHAADGDPDRGPGEEPGLRLSSAIAELADYISHPLGILATDLPHRIGPINLWRRYERVKARLDALLHHEIAVRRSSPDPAGRSDVASALVASTRTDGMELTDAELRDELITLVLAAYDTMATALAWTFLHVLGNEAVRSRLATECRAHEIDGPYLDAVVKEALRLHPPVPIVDRKVMVEASVGEFVLPPGVIIALCGWLIQRDGRYYERPLEFVPERFLDAQPDTYTWLPFGGGTRRCLGAAFAQLQMKSVVAAAISEHDLELGGGRERPRRRLIVLAPSRGARIRVRSAARGLVCA